jgi:hypothetical protein
MSGTTALSHCFSTKPSFDLEYAQMLYDAGGDINNRNRYGAYDPSDWIIVEKATKSLECFLTHGGSVDIADGDGITPRTLCDKLKGRIPAFKKLVEQEDEKSKLKALSRCYLCGTDKGKLQQMQKGQILLSSAPRLPEMGLADAQERVYTLGYAPSPVIVFLLIFSPGCSPGHSFGNYVD